MIYGSVCSGIEAATVAWHPLNWTPAWFAETAKFPSALLSHHYPGVTNYGDFTRIPRSAPVIDLLVGGTPCQSFSVAGRRAGLDDPRGNLALEFLALAGRLTPAWIVWENVPGVLSIDGGRAFRLFLTEMGKLGYGFAYRILDAQYFGVPQRRRRLFVVGCLGDWRRAAAVLFESQSLSGYIAPSRKKGQRVAGTLEARARTGGYDPGAHGAAAGHLVHCEPTSRALTSCKTATGRLDPNEQEFVAFNNTGHGWWNESDTASGLRDMSAGSGSKEATVVAFQSSQSGMRVGDQHPTLDSHNGSRRHHGALINSAVRRLTPEECESLQGFPRRYTLVPYNNKLAADGPRYAAIGISMAVPVMRWIGERISLIDSTL